MASDCVKIKKNTHKKKHDSCEVKGLVAVVVGSGEDVVLLRSLSTELFTFFAAAVNARLKRWVSSALLILYTRIKTYFY